MFKITSLISNSAFCVTVILYIYCLLSHIYFTDGLEGKTGHIFMDSGAARLNTSLVAHCNQENSIRDLQMYFLYKTHENRCIKWESWDCWSKQGHCLGCGNNWGSNVTWTFVFLDTQFQAARLPAGIFFYTWLPMVALSHKIQLESFRLWQEVRKQDLSCCYNWLDSKTQHPVSLRWTLLLWTAWFLLLQIFHLAWPNSFFLKFFGGFFVIVFDQRRTNT